MSDFKQLKSQTVFYSSTWGPEFCLLSNFIVNKINIYNQYYNQSFSVKDVRRCGFSQDMMVGYWIVSLGLMSDTRETVLYLQCQKVHSPLFLAAVYILFAQQSQTNQNRNFEVIL